MSERGSGLLSSSSSSNSVSPLGTGRGHKKLQRVCDQLYKQTGLKEKDVQKFVDLMSSDYVELYSPDYFDVFRTKRVEGENADIVKYLIESASLDSMPKKCVCLEVIRNLMADPKTRERFLGAQVWTVLIALLRTVNPADRITEVMGIQVLRILSILVDDTEFRRQRMADVRAILDALLAMVKQCHTQNEVLMAEIGRALMPFYLSGEHDEKGNTWGGNPIKYMLMAAQSRQAAFHHEIQADECQKQNEVFSSPLCKVYRGTWQSHSVAIKQFSQYGLGFSWDDFYKEVGLLCVAQHPNVVKFYGAHTAGGKAEEPFIVLEYCAKGNLHDYVAAHFKKSPAGFDAITTLSMCIDMAKGLAFLHSLGIVHRDVKTSNFLVADDNSVKMIDFGVSRIASTSVIMTTVGTPTFMAPEVLDGQMYTLKADVYSFGMVTFELLSGQEPFHDTPGLKLAGEVLSGKRPTVSAAVESRLPGLVALMRKCWGDESGRPTFHEVCLQLLRLRNSLAMTPRGASAAAAAHAVNAFPGIPIMAGPPALPVGRTGGAGAPAPYRTVGATAGGGGASGPNGDLTSYPWYYGDLPKEAAVDLLANKPVGTFLVRNSSRPNCFAASVVFADGIRHILIQPGAGGRYVVDALDNRNYNFKSIPAVVKSYSNILVHPCDRPQNSGIYSSVPQ